MSWLLHAWVCATHIAIQSSHPESAPTRGTLDIIIPRGRFDKDEGDAVAVASLIDYNNGVAIFPPLYAWWRTTATQHINTQGSIRLKLHHPSTPRSCYHSYCFSANDAPTPPSYAQYHHS